MKKKNYKKLSHRRYRRDACKRPFEVTQGHPLLCQSTRYIWLIILNSNLTSIFNRSWDITPSLHIHTPPLQWRREGGEGGHAEGRHCAGSSILRGENMEFWNLVAYGGLAFALRFVNLLLNLWLIDWLQIDSDILHPLRSLTFPQFWDHTPTVSATRPHMKQLYTSRNYTADLTDHSPAVKL